jgi:hypothetical protein
MLARISEGNPLAINELDQRIEMRRKVWNACGSESTTPPLQHVPVFQHNKCPPTAPLHRSSLSPLFGGRICFPKEILLFGCGTAGAGAGQATASPREEGGDRSRASRPISRLQQGLLYLLSPHLVYT